MPSLPTSRDRLEAALARIADPDGEGARACLTVYAEEARASAEAADARARLGHPLGPLDGALVAIKDLFDVAGEPTRAGSAVRADAPAAMADAPAVRRLRAAGCVIVAKTGMNEFAFSGLGVNPHHGTPGNPHDRARLPGGSTSGGAVAVADGFAQIALGSDTGGSCRIPAAWCGVTGFKPTQARVPREGAYPLSYTLDCIGPLARTVAEIRLADAVLAGEEAGPGLPLALDGARVGVLRGLPFEGIEAPVAAGFEAAIETLARAGASVTDVATGLMDEVRAAGAGGGFAPAEAYAIHRAALGTHGDAYDPRVRARIERGAGMSAADYIDLARTRARLMGAWRRELRNYDALALPTTPTLPPRLAEVEADEAFFAANALALRNPSLANFLDLPAISLPLPAAPMVGLMLFGRTGGDARLLALAQAAEAALRA